MADWRLWHDDQAGTVTQIKLDRDSNGRRQIIARQTISHHLFNAVFDANSAIAAPIGAYLHGTQRHRAPIARLPKSLYYRLRRMLGDPKHPDNLAKWKAWLNDPDNRHFRIAQGRL